MRTLSISEKLTTRVRRDGEASATTTVVVTGGTAQTVSNAASLGGFPAADYLRRAINEVVTGIFNFQNGLNIGGDENTEDNKQYVRGLNSTDIAWVSKFKNIYNAANIGYGIGLKLNLGSTTENNKWAGIAAVAESAYANNVGLVFYTTKAGVPHSYIEIDADGNFKILGRLKISDKWEVGYNPANNDLEFYGSDGNKKAMVDQSGNLYGTANVIAYSTR